MEVSYSEQAALPVERSRGFTMYRESLDYYSAVCPCVSTVAVGKPERGTLQYLAPFFQEGGFFPLDMSFFYSTYLDNFCLSPHSSVALSLAAEELTN